MRYLLDANILLLLVRGSDAGFIADLEARFDLFTGRNRVHISYATVGEIRVIAEKNRWGAAKWQALTRYLDALQVVNLTGDAILDAYVAVDTFSHYFGRDMGSKSDIWIAATANVYRMTLVTAHADFDHLAGEYCTVARVLTVPQTVP